MVDSYQEWWADEISEKFKALMNWLRMFALACLVVKAGGLWYNFSLSNILSQVLIIVAVLFFSWLGKWLEQTSPWCKVGYAMVLTELTTVFNLTMSRNLLPEHELIMMFSSAIVLVCVQLSFVYSYTWAVLLIFKFEYQWYISRLLSQEIPWPPVTTPFAAIAGAILFYCYYKQFLDQYSYNLFLSRKLLRAKDEDKAVLLKLIADGLMVLDGSHRVTFTNDNILRIFDVPVSELLDAIIPLQYPEGRKMCELTRSSSLINDIFACFELGINSEVTLGVTTTGDTNLEWRGKKIRWTNQEVVLVSCRDVTSLLELERSHKENDRKQVMLRSVSHDLNSPTQAIKAVSEQILRTEDLSPNGVAKVNQILYGSELLLRLIQDILDYSRIVAGVFKIRKDTHNIRRLIDSCIELTSSQLNPEKVSLITRIDPNIPTLVYTDSVRFQQVLINLLSNAVKFTTKGSIEVCAYISYCHKLKIEVHDTGIGMTEETLARLFELFNPGGRPGLNEYGNGIGLNLANSLAIELGGRPIRPKSQYGLGSTFTFTVNISEMDLGETSSESEPSEDPSEGPGIPINPVTYPPEIFDDSHILLVDDNEYTCGITSNNLTECLLKHITAASGEDAIQTTLRRADTDGQIQVILMDINMTPMSGIEATKALRHLHENQQLPFMPVIIGYTADNSSEAVQECLEVGMVKVLPRSTSAHDLVSTIASFLRR